MLQGYLHPYWSALQSRGEPIVSCYKKGAVSRKNTAENVVYSTVEYVQCRQSRTKAIEALAAVRNLDVNFHQNQKGKRNYQDTPE
jgi:hypothetical protein